MSKLNDLQSVLLASAAQRDTGSVYPAPETLADAGARLTKAVAALIKLGLAEERETSDTAAASRTDGDLNFGVYITDAGCTAIGVGEAPEGAEQPALLAAEPVARTSKISTVVTLLQRDGGATLPELIAATGWLPHTTRAALTGIRKKGHAVDRVKLDGATCYRIAVAVAA